MKRKITLSLFCLLFFGSFVLNAQIERPKWELGGGFRLNYLGLDGGYEGEINPNVNYPDGYRFKLNYKDIGMDNYSPSMAIANGNITITFSIEDPKDSTYWMPVNAGEPYYFVVRYYKPDVNNLPKKPCS